MATYRNTLTRIAPAARFAALAVAASWGALAAVAVAQDGAAADRSTLEAFYDATGGESWTDATNWKTEAPLDTWYGVTTDAVGRVTKLELGENGLTGSLTPGLGDLASLDRLGLWRNELTGEIPGELGNLANLEQLSMGGNELTGPIPDELGNLVNLELLYLWGNELTGPVPAWLGDLTRLRWVQLSNNELTSPIPDELGSLVQLEVLYLHGNELTGPVPAWLENLTRLRWLNLGGNELRGSIPDELRNLGQLERLHLWGNKLTGPVPAWLGNLTRLQQLLLSWNRLSGPIPDELSSLSQLEWLYLRGNELTGPIPAWLGNLTRLDRLYLGANGLTGGVPGELGGLSNLERLDVSYNWGLSGPLPAELSRLAGLEELDAFVTPACAPAAWEDWLETIEFYGRLCEPAADATIDVAVLYTTAAREGAGNIEATIDLMAAETNQALEESGVPHRLRLVARSEVQYSETGDSLEDLRRLANPSDGYLDEAHALRDRVGADLVHLIVHELEEYCGRANIQGPFGVTQRACGGSTFAHELGHNMGLWHDRYRVRHHETGPYPHPAHGYVNQPGLRSGASSSRRWRTLMAYATQCSDDGLSCRRLLRFSNPRQTRNDDPLGVAYGDAGSGVTGPADAAAVLDHTGPIVARWRKGPALDANRPPALVDTLPDRSLPPPPGMLAVDVAGAFADPDGDALTYTVSSSAPDVAAVGVAGALVTLTSVGAGTARIEVTATDPGGLSATGSFTVTVPAPGTFTDDPIRPGVTPVRAIHLIELRTRIDALRREAGLDAFAWTDPVLTAGGTPVRLTHLLELRQALAAAYAAAGRAAPVWTDAAPAAGTTLIRAAHVAELRAAVMALE